MSDITNDEPIQNEYFLLKNQGQNYKEPDNLINKGKLGIFFV